jgi:hypothetical protein
MKPSKPKRSTLLLISLLDDLLSGNILVKFIQSMRDGGELAGPIIPSPARTY